MKLIPRILAVDPDSKSLDVLYALLCPQGYELVAATSCEEGLAKARIDVDLVTAPLQMNGLGGAELCRRLKADPVTRLIPVILLVSAGDEAGRAVAVEAGCDDVVSCPLEREELLSRLETLIRLSHFRPLIDATGHLDDMLENIDDALVTLDASLGMLRLNRRARLLFGISDEAKGALFFDCIADAFKMDSVPADLFSQIKKTPMRFDLERPETASTRPLILEARTSIVVNPFREITGIVMLFSDVTDLRRQQFLQENFMNLISHKLTTPLGILYKNATMFEQGVFGPMNDDQKKFIGVIVEKSLDLKEAFEKLIAMTAALGRKLDAPPEPVDLDWHLGAQLDAVKKKYPDKNVETKLEKAEEGMMARIGKKYFDLILSNLLENAVKFCDKPEGKLRLAAWRAGDRIEFLVEDNGSGIPAEELEKIFIPFYQVDKHRTLNVRGVGLGLALASELIAAHGGRLVVESKLGQGTTFCFSLPAYKN